MLEGVKCLLRTFLILVSINGCQTPAEGNWNKDSLGAGSYALMAVFKALTGHKGECFNLGIIIIYTLFRYCRVLDHFMALCIDCG